MDLPDDAPSCARFDREIEDLDAMILAAGGSATVFGYSSGAVLALKAAAHGLAITNLVLGARRRGGAAQGRALQSRRPGPRHQPGSHGACHGEFLAQH
jgi:pimeloyl-ACP methyl ester carboxylesterase